MVDQQRVPVRERLEVCIAFGIWWSSKTLSKEIAGGEEWAPGHMAERVEGRGGEEAETVLPNQPQSDTERAGGPTMNGGAELFVFEFSFSLKQDKSSQLGL